MNILDTLAQKDILSKLARWIEVRVTEGKTLGMGGNNLKCPVALYLSEMTGKTVCVEPNEWKAGTFDWRDVESGFLPPTLSSLIKRLDAEFGSDYIQAERALEIIRQVESANMTLVY